MPGDEPLVIGARALVRIQGLGWPRQFGFRKGGARFLASARESLRAGRRPDDAS
jgi:hypothetical protein